MARKVNTRDASRGGAWRGAGREPHATITAHSAHAARARARPGRTMRSAPHRSRPTHGDGIPIQRSVPPRERATASRPHARPTRPLVNRSSRLVLVSSLFPTLRPPVAVPPKLLAPHAAQSAADGLSSARSRELTACMYASRWRCGIARLPAPPNSTAYT